MAVKQIIGSKDFVTFPNLGMMTVKCKIDTGADSCSLHASKIKEVTVGDSKVLTCYIQPKVKTTFHRFKVKKVKSSNGIPQTRYKVPMKIVVMGREFNTEFTLTNRSKMTFPVLLGKNLLRGNFIVDVAQTNLSQRIK